MIALAKPRAILAMTGVLIVSLLVVGSTTVHAQEPELGAQHVPAWVANIGPQLSEELASPSVDVRRAALQHTAYFAYFYEDALDLSATLPRLLDLFENADDEQSRLIALAAIHAIGDEEAMQQVRSTVRPNFEDAVSMRLQFVTMAALTDFYGAGTFKDDDYAARLARELVDYYLSPEVIVGPPIIIDP